MFFCYCSNSVLNKWFVVQNLKIANKKLISKLFVQHLSGDKRQNKEKRNSIDCQIKLNKDDWMFEKGKCIITQDFQVVNKFFSTA